MAHSSCPKCGHRATHTTPAPGVEELSRRSVVCLNKECGYAEHVVEITAERLNHLNSILYRWNQMRAWMLPP